MGSDPNLAGFPCSAVRLLICVVCWPIRIARAFRPSPQCKRPAAAPHGALIHAACRRHGRRNRRDGGAHALGQKDRRLVSTSLFSTKLGHVTNFFLGMTKFFVIAAWFLILVPFIAACGKHELTPLPLADRAVIGHLKSTSTLDEITDRKQVNSLLNFANLQRRGGWSGVGVIHSSCTLSVTFFTGAQRQGYLAIDGASLFTNGPRGEFNKDVTAAEIQSFRELIPAEMRPRAAKNRC